MARLTAIRRSIEGVDPHQEVAVHEAADARGVDGVDEVRPDAGARRHPVRGGHPDHLGAVHVAMHHLGPPATEQIGHQVRRTSVVGLLDDLDTHAQRPPATDRTAVRERDDPHVVAITVDA